MRLKNAISGFLIKQEMEVFFALMAILRPTEVVQMDKIPRFNYLSGNGTLTDRKSPPVCEKQNVHMVFLHGRDFSVLKV